MKRLLLLLLLSGCGSKDAEEDPGAAGDEPLAANLAAAPAAEDPAVLQARAAAALRPVIGDPDQAAFADVRAATAGAICGRVDAKGPDGKRTGPRPFVVTPEGVAVVSTTPDVSFNEPSDPFPDYYIRWCATTEALARLGTDAAIAGETGPGGAPGDIPDLAQAGIPTDDPLPPAAPVPAPSPPPTESAAKAAPPPPSAEGDSFFNAVIRNRQAAKAKD